MNGIRKGWPIPAAELESATSGLGNQRSIQLSYAGDTLKRYLRFPAEASRRFLFVIDHFSSCMDVHRNKRSRFCMKARRLPASLCRDF
jgi:hypothetical protein